MAVQYLRGVFIRAKPLVIAMHPHGIVNQSEDVANISLGVLGARSSLVIANDFDGITASFLMIRMRYMLQIEGLTLDNGPIMAVVAQGNSSGAEIQAAINHQNPAGPDDVTEMIDQTAMKPIVYDTLRTFRTDGLTRGQLTTGWIKMGRKGIPFGEGNGWVVHAFNGDNSTLDSGAVVKGIIQYQGVWLRD